MFSQNEAKKRSDFNGRNPPTSAALAESRPKRKTEHDAIAAKRFQAADADHDGTLDKEELGSKVGKALMRMLQ